MDRNLVNQFVAPVAGVLVIALIYTLHIPSIKAASDIIDGYRAATPQDKLVAFERAVSRDSFAQQEIAEQIAQQAMSIVNDQNVSQEIRQKYVALAESELLRLINDKPGDARIHVFTGTFYRSLGELVKAEEQMAKARELSPNKQTIISQQAIIAYSKGDLPAARDFFKEAFLLDERNYEAREFYAALLFLTGEPNEAKALAYNETAINRFAVNDFVMSAVKQAGENAFMIELYKARIAQQPGVEQNFASLAFLYQQLGQTDLAVTTLRDAAKAKPSFSKTANCIADNLEAGRPAEEGC